MNMLKYRISQIFYTSQDDDKYYIVNSISKKPFLTTSKVSELFNSFQGREFELDELQSFYKEMYTKEDIDSVISRFLKHKILIPSQYDETLVVIPPVFPLFGQSKRCEIEDIKDSVVILGIPYGKGNPISTEVSKFPNKFRKFLHKFNIKEVNRESLNISKSLNSKTLKKVLDIGDLYIYDMEYPKDSLNKIESITGLIAKNHNYVINIGGDHSITFPIVKALATHYNNLVVIQLDAHTDIYESRIHDIYQKKGYASIHHGNFMCETLNLSQITQVIQYGIRGLANTQIYKRDKLHSFYLSEKDRFINHIKNLKAEIPIYISIDIDFFDSSIAPATATPETDGASFRLFDDIITELANKNIIGIDLTEVNPKFDSKDITLQLSGKIIAILLNALTRHNE